MIHDDLRNEESKNDLAHLASHVHTKNGLRIGPETAVEPSDANCPVRLSFLPGPTAQIAVCSSMKSKKTRPSASLVALCCFICFIVESSNLEVRLLQLSEAVRAVTIRFFRFGNALLEEVKPALGSHGFGVTLSKNYQNSKNKHPLQLCIRTELATACYGYIMTHLGASLCGKQRSGPKP